MKERFKSLFLVIRSVHNRQDEPISQATAVQRWCIEVVGGIEWGGVALVVNARYACSFHQQGYTTTNTVTYSMRRKCPIKKDCAQDNLRSVHLTREFIVPQNLRYNELAWAGCAAIFSALKFQKSNRASKGACIWHCSRALNAKTSDTLSS